MDKKQMLNDAWTARWHLRKDDATGALPYLDSIVASLEGKKNTPPPTPPAAAPQAPSIPPLVDASWKRGAGLELIPFAVQSKRRLKTKGRYPLGYARGAVVHFTAGRYEMGRQNAVNEINVTPYTFLCIGTDGTLVQGHDVSRWGNHAGESAWTHVASKLKLVGSVSDDLIGIEMNNAGLLKKIGDKYYAWFHLKNGKPIGTGSIPANEVRYVTEKEYGCPTGYYHKFTPEQEATLIKTLLWLDANDPIGCFSFDHVLGHHEVSGMLGIKKWRKNDPGGALSMPMSQLRALLKDMSAG